MVRIQPPLPFSTKHISKGPYRRHSLRKDWNDNSTNWYDIPGLANYTLKIGTGYGEINKDLNYGSANTGVIAAITSWSQGGYHPAARCCDKLVYGGYDDGIYLIVMSLI